MVHSRAIRDLALAAGLALALGSVPAPAASEGFRPVTSREAFFRIVEGRSLNRFGITLRLAPGGEITGRAFGRDVRGTWDWQGSYFCREIVAGALDLPRNCQAVLKSDGTLRFIADRGQGDTADLRIE